MRSIRRKRDVRLTISSAPAPDASDYQDPRHNVRRGYRNDRHPLRTGAEHSWDWRFTSVDCDHLESVVVELTVSLTGSDLALVSGAEAAGESVDVDFADVLALRLSFL